MKFVYYEAKELNDFENKLKALALNKKYKFSKEVEVLKEDEILEKTNSQNRELLKIFKNNAKIISYHFKSHKSNYLVIVGETRATNIIGLTIIFNKKPFKQFGKLAAGAAILSLPVGGLVLAPIALVAGVGLAASSGKGALTFKGPLKNGINEIIRSTLGEPVEIKE
ncbi:hypothetical protein BUZ15_08675 [Staphylococcus gallinarum]|uniref:hypothetical protein n=1 Tax=Staphylococcus TaxID=1279 RepID=UPI000A392F74|nr:MULTISPECIES: hypothetical protein [Staphylococcus]EGQ1611846.1 hypothetical protein [Staphylococcus pseudintermedius]MDR5649451.1 hypothetical protein [Staphylococcus nepalensis]PTL09857.1 hypothetical protein BUZ15_08675 [Staphylococcus gallinarum]HAR6210855.1 hypothetical protein [Staphylococcus pseudintermedius]HCS9102226.1 hypothetical protein [Staphylococcus pseudintermedius]